MKESKTTKLKRKKVKRRVRFDRIFLFLFILCLLIGCFTFIWNLKISNIYIFNNQYLKDQEIIDFAGISDYPATIQNLSFQIEKKLEQNPFIKEATVTKKWFTKVYINIVENRPLFFYSNSNSTILLDGTSTETKYSVPTVLNYITDTYFDDFVIEMGKLDSNVLNRISEIKFYPNEVDDNRFLLSMSDGNYVYVNIDTFHKLNKYISILESLPSEKGILYLDYGNNFEIIK